MTPEAKVVASIERFLKTVSGLWYVKTSGGNLRAGTPDILVCYAGRFVALEVKAQNGQATDLQTATLRDIVMCKGAMKVAHDVEDVRLLLDQIEPIILIERVKS